MVSCNFKFHKKRKYTSFCFNCYSLNTTSFDRYIETVLEFGLGFCDNVSFFMSLNLQVRKYCTIQKIVNTRVLHIYSQQHDGILFISNLHTTDDFYWSGEANMLEG